MQSGKAIKAGESSSTLKRLQRAGTIGSFGSFVTSRSKQPTVHKKSLIESEYDRKPSKPILYDDLVDADKKRKKMLGLARNISPIDTVGRLSMLPRTVIPRILRHWPSWMVGITYGASSGLARWGRWDLTSIELDLTAFDGGSSIVVFMIVFYVGYCYSRYVEIFHDVEIIIRSIINACVLARTCFESEEDVHKLWRYLNLLHAAAYCGLTNSYNHDNFFYPLIEKYGLAGTGVQKEIETRDLKAIDIDEQGLTAVTMYQALTLDLIRENASASKTMAPPIHAQLNAQIVDIGDCIKQLYSYSYQVLPFIYTHLVSLTCCVYLIFNAFIKGLYFQPRASYTFGFIMPLANVFTVTLAMFGLLEVGDTILDPMGCDPEDFAILHLVEWTCVSSLDAIAIKRRANDKKNKPPPSPTKGAFTNLAELRAAATLARLVANWRKRRKAKQPRLPVVRRSATATPIISAAEEAPQKVPNEKEARLKGVKCRSSLTREHRSSTHRSEHPGKQVGRDTGSRKSANGRQSSNVRSRRESSESWKSRIRANSPFNGGTHPGQSGSLHA